ncbi:phosphonopyruvate decarboxylase [Caedibacter taeniospiralis]|uniref:phosphonopyruvate decarboxylase n=1 Tax=Caedibacter taeniospiralis TaxID=28907 RepID=UPI000C276C1C|nr:phosphonopyruvate decarboxylase [Caedibacter taeniospiralis]
MICPEYFTNALIDRGVQFFTGVPCSYLTPLINEVIATEVTDYVIASSEGDALAMASGAWLAGKLGLVMCQNSGLGNMINPLTSLNAPFNIPVLLLITWRGKPGEPDEPQHEVMGKITTGLLDLMGIQWSYFPETEAEVLASLDKAMSVMGNAHCPYALILQKDSFKTGKPAPKVVEDAHLPTREEVLSTFLKSLPDEVSVIATTGKTGRELYTLQDHSKHFYCVGSMGYANALAHGVALNSKKPVFVIDGDGAAIMHLGNLTSIGASAPSNLVHVILDNGTYDSTGAQATVSEYVDFAALAKSLGYKKQFRCSSLRDFSNALKTVDSGGPALIHLKIKSGSMKNLGRPAVKPHEIARRLRQHIQKMEQGE